MHCEPLIVDGRVVGIVCSSGRRKAATPRCGFCDIPSAALCDYPVTPGRTCDKPLCRAHAHSLPNDRDLCPLHAPPRRRGDYPFGTDIFAPLVTHPVPHGPACPRCAAGLCHGCAACQGERVHRLAPRLLSGPWVGIVGARDHGNLAQLDAEVDALAPETVVVSGGARGADGYGVARARARGLRTVVLEADWNRGGRVAGFQRNGEVVAVVDRLVAATWWGCRGTLDTIAKAEAVGLEVVRVKPNAGQLEVWTARLTPSPDPDLLDITNMTGRARSHGLAERWQKVPPAHRPRELVKALRGWEQSGASLVELQARAKVEHAPSIGSIWAPSSGLLFPTLTALDAVTARVEAAETVAMAADPDARTWGGTVRGPGLDEVRERARGEAAEVWAGYRVAFLAEMRERWRRFPEAWGWLLGRKRVVLACTCARPRYLDPGAPWAACHRFLVAEALGRCGARTMGELPNVNPHADQLVLTL